MSSFKLRKEKDCLNCGHSVEDHFCPHCGQENIELKEDAVHMVIHAIADYFHFEHKFFATIYPLLLKPGKLTTEYVTGKRVKFIHPIRLYIFISIVFFLFAFSGFNKNKNEEKSNHKVENNEKLLDDDTIDTTLTSKQKDSVIAEQLEGIKIGMKYLPGTKKFKDSVLKEAEKDLRKNGKTNINLVTGKKQAWGATNWLSKDTSVIQYEKKQLALPKEKRDGFIKHYFIKRSIELNGYENPKEKFIEDFLHNIPKMMFLLLPLFALILKLVYINKNRYYYEHLIYSFHVHSAIFLSILFSMLLEWLTGFIYDISSWIAFLCVAYITWYIYRSLRAFYGSTRWVTVLKLFFLTFAYNVVLTICFLIIIAVSFAMI